MCGGAVSGASWMHAQRILCRRYLKLTVLPLFAWLEPLNIHTQIVKVPSGGEARRGANTSRSRNSLTGNP